MRLKDLEMCYVHKSIYFLQDMEEYELNKEDVELMKIRSSIDYLAYLL
jgi:hypothetical protein